MTSTVQLDMQYVHAVRAIADKYLDVMYKSLEKQSDIDARQCIYYTAYGATLALFEALASLLANLPKQEKNALIEAHNAGQYVLNVSTKVEAMRKHEAIEFENAVRQGEDASGRTH